MDGSLRGVAGRRGLHLAGHHRGEPDHHHTAVGRPLQDRPADRGPRPLAHRLGRPGDGEPGQRQRVHVGVLAVVHHGRRQRRAQLLLQLPADRRQGSARVLLQRPQPQRGHRRRQRADAGAHRATGERGLGHRVAVRPGPARGLLRGALERLLPGPGDRHLPVRRRARRQDHGVDQQQPGLPRRGRQRRQLDPGHRRGADQGPAGADQGRTRRDRG